MKQPPRTPKVLDNVELRLLVGGKAYSSWFAARIIFITNETMTCKTPDGAILIRQLDEYDFIWRFPENNITPNGV